MVGKVVHVELKNDMVIVGTLQSVDQYLNIKLNDIEVENVERFPHMVSDSLSPLFYNFPDGVG